MPRPMHASSEKSKDFVGSIKRLLANLKPWKVLMGLAITLAFLSAILSLTAPNKLSSLTDVITNGIKPNTDVLQKIVTEISNNFNSEAMSEKTMLILTSEDISIEDKATYQAFLTKMQETTNKNNITENDSNTSDNKKIMKTILDLPSSILNVLVDDITVNGITISSEDEIAFLKSVIDIDASMVTDDTLKVMDNLPTSIYNLIKPNMDLAAAKKIIITLVCLYLLSAIFGYIQSYSMTTVSNGFAKNLRAKISIKINKLPLKFFDSHEIGDILSRVTNDVDTIAQNLNQSLATLISSVTLFIGSIIMMFTTNWVMAITAILSTLFGFTFMISILKKSQKYFIARQKELGNINGHIEEIYSGHNVVECYNAKGEVTKTFDELNGRLRECNKKSQFLSGLMQPMMGFIGNFGYVMVCIVGALLTMKGYITFGVIVAFMIYVRLFTNPLSQIAQAMTSLQTTAAASERVFEFLDEKEMTDESNKTKVLDKRKVKGDIEFKNVKFGYDNSRLIIKNFSASAHPGEKIAIVGPTGAGKTTMVNLLMKFYEINSGDILIDGVSTKDLTRENIHDLFIMVLQDTWLFEGSIRDNIKFNQEDVTDEEIWAACKTVGVDHFIKTLPGGLDCVIGENDSISSGQKQLLTIARGMIENAPFLILDEATSNVDTRTEELVQKAMDKLMEGRTSFIIAHRLSTIKNANLILVMNEGNIIEQGTHEELMKKNGFYADLYNSQFKK
ncbi:MAG: ABC transporter ATP-binding protein [Bacilli bacterium]|nr:ABC transporter ATP-binding protein [Bacilli bacterium]